MKVLLLLPHLCSVHVSCFQYVDVAGSNEWMLNQAAYLGLACSFAMAGGRVAGRKALHPRNAGRRPDRK